MLGEPMKEVGVDIGHPNYADSEKAHFEVKLKGPNAKGSMFFWAEKIKEVEDWNVSRIEFQLKDDDKRLVVKKSLESVTQ
jgi:Cytochrome oxidase complex assembly protein 1